MYWKEMLGAIAKPDKNAKTYELSTDYKFEGLQEYPRPQLQRSSYSANLILILMVSGITVLLVVRAKWFPLGL